MSALATIHLVLSAMLFAIVFIERNDEPFWLRTFTAAILALFWLPFLMIIVLVYLTIDWVTIKLKGLRK
jgi:hypothetical protein